MEFDKAEEMVRSSGMKNPYADSIRATALTDDLHLFWVVNTAGRKQFVLAKEPRYARVLSQMAAHIRERDNGEVFKASEKFFTNNPGFGSAVRRAIKDRRPGVVQKKGEHAVMGDKVYSPLSVA